MCLINVTCKYLLATYGPSAKWPCQAPCGLWMASLFKTEHLDMAGDSTTLGSINRGLHQSL